MKQYIRICPKCKNEIIHKEKSGYLCGIRKNKLCKSCSHVGNTNSRKWNKTTNNYDFKLKKWKRKCPKCSVFIFHTRYFNMIHNNKFCQSCSKLGNTNCVERISSEKTKRKMRMSAIKRIERDRLDGNQIIPSFNKNACQIIDEYGKQNGYKFKHAMNGGEFFIKDLGYWVDGVDHKRKVIIEYFENFHKKKIQKDKRRLKEIKEETDYKIIILKEWTNKIEII